MTEAEAIERLRNYFYEYDVNRPALFLNGALAVVIKATEKQIAKKVIIERECFGVSKDGEKLFVFSYFCPICNMLVRVKSRHCDNCGQKLDWSEV